MKKLLLSISLFGVLNLLSSFTNSPATNHETSVAKISLVSEKAITLYKTLNLEDLGLSQDAFELAYKGYEQLLKNNKLSNPGYLTICDMSQPSGNKRLYLVDIENCSITMNTYVAHGRNSGMEYATKFSNKPESLQSSLGFFVTRQTYQGQHGLSLRVSGMEPGFNDKAMERAIVIHGADYIGTSRLKNSAFMGRSFGCPAVPKEESAQLINTIKNGTCLFIYHPAKNYLRGSKILNG